MTNRIDWFITSVHTIKGDSTIENDVVHIM